MTAHLPHRDRRGGLPRGLALAFIAMALIVRAFVPAGWMPNVDTRFFGLMPCLGIAAPAHGAGHALMVQEMHGVHHDHGHDHDRGQPCAFTVLAMAVDIAPAVVVVPAPLAVAPVAHRIERLVAVGRGLAAPPPPSTGPPRLI